ncbi:TraI domain-containing protein, partial [Escherichia coli]|nr:TraI domain-containing protein [Escherichia coli]
NADEAAWGSVGAIVRTADQMSVEADLRIATQTGRTRQFTGAATTLENFGERLMRTLRLLVEQRQLPVNRPGATLFTSDDRVYVYAVAKTLA